MGEIGALSNSVSDTVLSTYSAFASQQAQNGIAALLPGAGLTTAPIPSTTIILRVEQASGVTTSRSVTVASFAGQLLAPYEQLLTAPPQSVSQLTFDVAPSPVTGPDGFAQSIRETYAARETIHQTASGFYVDQFALAPGQFSITVATLIRGDFIKRLKNFTDVLRGAKASAANLQPGAPPVLRYINSVDGRSLLLSQTDLAFDQAAERPNIVYITINGTILQDYAYPQSTSTPVSLPAIGQLVSTTVVNTPSAASLINAATQNTSAFGTSGLSGTNILSGLPVSVPVG